MALMIFMNERDAPPVSEQPKVSVMRWRVYACGAGERYLLAQLPSGTLRITSALAEVYTASKTVVTSSGRAYQLEEPPTADVDMVLKFEAYARMNGLTELVDDSEAVWGSPG